MYVPSRFPPELHAGPFTLLQAKESLVPPGQLRRKEVIRISRGIKCLADADLSLALLTRPYTLLTGYSAASHATAFAIWEFPGFLPVPDQSLIHITRQVPHNIPRRKGVIGHRTKVRNDEVESLDGLWITSRVRTWLDCARRMTIEELVVVADHLIRIPRPAFEARSTPFATLEELSEMLNRHKGTPGIQKARAALDLARVGSDSAPETRLRLAVVRSGLPEPDINVTVSLAAGTERTPDASFPEYKVAVEYDGGTHADPAQVSKDIRRQEDYEASGWIEIRIDKTHMGNEARAAVRKIRNALYLRGWRPERK